MNFCFLYRLVLRMLKPNRFNIHKFRRNHNPSRLPILSRSRISNYSTTEPFFTEDIISPDAGRPACRLWRRPLKTRTDPEFGRGSDASTVQPFVWA
jgi:hypothetical protein